MIAVITKLVHLVAEGLSLKLYGSFTPTFNYFELSIVD